MWFLNAIRKIVKLFCVFFSLKIPKRYERGDRKHEIYSVRPKATTCTTHFFFNFKRDISYHTIQDFYLRISISLVFCTHGSVLWTWWIWLGKKFPWDLAVGIEQYYCKLAWFVGQILNRVSIQTNWLPTQNLCCNPGIRNDRLHIMNRGGQKNCEYQFMNYSKETYWKKRRKAGKNMKFPAKSWKRTPLSPCTKCCNLKPKSITVNVGSWQYFRSYFVCHSSYLTEK